MAMTIMNNPSAMLTLGQLNKNVSKVTKDLKKVSSGMKLNSAGDDASAYSISEKMRVQIRGLSQDIENVQKGKSMLTVGTGGIDNIIDELRNLKELAINAANDHNTDKDRATIQKEFDQRMENIDDIASTTNYNGKLLLNGHYDYKRLIRIENDNTAQKVNETISSGSVSTGVIEPSGTPTIISSGPYTIKKDGIYVLDSGFTGEITIDNGLQGVKIQQATPNQLTDVFIKGPTNGNANLWLDGLNIKNTTDTSCIKFYGNNNVLSIKGNNTLTYSMLERKTAIINIGDGLTIEGTGTLECNEFHSYASMIGTDRAEKSSANLTINSGTYILTAANSRTNTISPGGCMGALIGAGGGGNIGEITINGGYYDIYQSGGGAGIGSGTKGNSGNITIKNATVIATSDDGACIGSGENSNVGNILIENSIIAVESKTLFTKLPPSSIINVNKGQGAGVGSGGGSGGFSSSAGDIIIRNSTINASSNLGAGIGSGYKSHAGDITINNVSGFVTSRDGDAIGKGLEGTVGNINNDGSIGTYNGSNSNMDAYYREELIKTTFFVIHTGTRANQALYCYIPNMHTKNMGLENVNVLTQQKAEASLEKLDTALNYALDAATEVGAYIQELNATEANLVTSNENTIFSESTIRDTDMAKSMMEYTKANVLSQASQSMLAQANQTSASVLSLLQ